MHDQTPLERLLASDRRAREFYDQLHLSVRASVDAQADSIDTADDLAQAAQQTMSEVFTEYDTLFEDGVPLDSAHDPSIEKA